MIEISTLIFLLILTIANAVSIAMQVRALKSTKITTTDNEDEQAILKRFENLEVSIKQLRVRLARQEETLQSKTRDSRLPTPDSEEEPKDFWDDMDALVNFLEPETNKELFKDLAQTNPLDAQRIAAIRLKELREQRPRV